LTKPKWGTKQDCQSCGACFYDLGMEPAVCPKCGTELRASARAGALPPPARPAPKLKAEPAAKPDGKREEKTGDDPIDEEDDDALLDNGDDAADVLEDDSEEEK
jgi:hypothetical protein